MSSNRPFTVIGWYHLGFFHPMIRRTMMVLTTFVVASVFMFYIMPIKYAIAAFLTWLVFFGIFLLLRYGKEY